MTHIDKLNEILDAPRAAAELEDLNTNLDDLNRTLYAARQRLDDDATLNRDISGYLSLAFRLVAEATEKLADAASYLDDALSTAAGLDEDAEVRDLEDADELARVEADQVTFGRGGNGPSVITMAATPDENGSYFRFTPISSGR